MARALQGIAMGLTRLLEAVSSGQILNTGFGLVDRSVVVTVDFVHNQTLRGFCLSVNATHKCDWFELV